MNMKEKTLVSGEITRFGKQEYPNSMAFQSVIGMFVPGKARAYVDDASDEYDCTCLVLTGDNLWCSATRTLLFDDDEVRLHCDYFRVHHTVTRGGLGTVQLARQVSLATRLGIRKMDCTAARSDQVDPDFCFVGYLVWPLLGYDAQVSYFDDDGNYSSASVLELCQTEHGRQWWKYHGCLLSWITMEFDCTRGSRSREVLAHKLWALRKKIGTKGIRILESLLDEE